MSHARRSAMLEVISELEALVRLKGSTRGRNTFAEQLAERTRLGGKKPDEEETMTPARLAVHARELYEKKTGLALEGCTVSVKPDGTVGLSLVGSIPIDQRGGGGAPPPKGR